MTLCGCGCGRRTPIAKKTHAKRGDVAGRPTRFCLGHNSRRSLEGAYRVDEQTGCWVWLRKTDANGYGRLRRNGRFLLAHRYFYELYVGPIPPGLQIDHLCLNRACVNPNHLEPVTGRENVRRSSATKLTADAVLVIKRSLEPSAVVAERFGISPNHVRTLRAGLRWTDVELVTR